MIKKIVYFFNSKVLAKQLVLLLLGFFINENLYSQITLNDTLKLSRQDYEAVFLKQNLLLLAEKFRISEAEAMMAQAKLWPNPTLTLEDVNLWSTQKNRAYLDEPLPRVFGNAAENTQFAIQLEQQIITSGKRKKQIQLEETGVKIAEQEFQELLRQLKFDFRNTLTELQYLQLNEKLFLQQQQQLDNLLKAYKRQYENNHISKGDYLRLQTLKFELTKEINSLAKERNEKEAALKVFLSINPEINLEVLEQDFIPDLKKFQDLALYNIQDDVLSQRSDIQLATLERKYSENQLSLEKSQVLPDINLSASYDRGGGIWPSFFGFGVSFELPLFNRNQGAIAAAKYGIENAALNVNAVQLKAKTEYHQNLKDLQRAINFYESIDPEFEDELDAIFENYTKNFRNRNISLLQYLDFQEAYLENKKIFLEAQKDIHLHLEILQYTIGKEI